MQHSQTLEAATKPGSVPGLVQRVFDLLGAIPHSVIAIVARLSIAAVFWQSGRTKVDGFMLNDTAVYLFENEYKLPFLDPTLAATFAAISEHLFPILLVLGLGSRFAALALLGMTLVIQLFVYPGAWPTHATWAACLLVVIARGPGVISLDHLVTRWTRQKQ